MDVLFPRVGEMVGGSQREARLDELTLTLPLALPLALPPPSRSP